MEIRALIRSKCGNMEEKTKYWLKKIDGLCVFYEQKRDNMSHFIGECGIIRN